MSNLNPTILAAMIAASAALGTAFFAFIAALINATVARKNAILSAQIAQRTKRAEFRQAWINQLRDCIAKLQSASANKDGIGPEGLEHGIKILLMLNRQDKNYDPLRQCIAIFSKNTSSSEEKDKAHAEFVKIAQDILREEWLVIKSEINHFEDDAVSTMKIGRL